MLRKASFSVAEALVWQHHNAAATVIESGSSLPLAMIFSPFKKKNYKKKRNVFNITPPSKTELRQALLQTYKSKAKNPSKLPILIWMNNHKNLEENWLRDLLGSSDTDSKSIFPPLCLMYCFFIGRTDNVFESSVGRSKEKEYCKIKCIQFLSREFQEQFAACARLIDDNTREKYSITDAMVAKLLSSIEECSNFVWSKENPVCPLEAFLLEQNSTVGPGWLRILLFQHINRDIRPQNDRCKLVVILHTIIRGFCGNSGRELCTNKEYHTVAPIDFERFSLEYSSTTNTRKSK